MSIFLGFGEDAKFLIRCLVVIVCILGVSVVGLAYKVFNRDVLYINPSAITGTARVGYITPEFAGAFADAFVSYLGNVNKESANTQYRQAYLLMSPELQSALQPVLRKDLEAINSSDLSIQTVPIKHNTEGYTGKTFNITVNATRVSWSRGQVGSKQTAIYTIACQKASVTQTNPFGLEVISYDFKITNDIATDNSAPPASN